jgi:hypothetical protein
MTLPLLLPAPIDAELPVRSADDVRAQWPPNVRNRENAPVRDALAEAFAEAFYAYQAHASYAAAQSDPARATDQYVASFAVEVGIYPQEGEADDALRDRLFTVPAVVTPAAILGIANDVLGRYTTAQAQLCESVLDRWYVFAGDPAEANHSFVTDGTASVTPLYIGRRYDVRPQRSPTGALPFPDHQGRLFVLRVPDIGAAAQYSTYADDGTTGDTSLGMFVSDGDLGNLFGQSTLFAGMQSALSAYQQIANAIDRILGQGVRWVLWVDEKLTT